jgi:hypothetical protein
VDYVRLIQTFSTGTYAITRRVVGTYVQGALVNGATIVLNVAASVQPTSSKMLQVLPEGLQSGKHYTVYTREELFSRERGQACDTITIEGEAFEVVQVDRFDGLESVNTYYRSIAARVL